VKVYFTTSVVYLYIADYHCM